MFMLPLTSTFGPNSPNSDEHALAVVSNSNYKTLKVMHDPTKTNRSFSTRVTLREAGSGAFDNVSGTLTVHCRETAEPHTPSTDSTSTMIPPPTAAPVQMKCERALDLVFLVDKSASLEKTAYGGYTGAFAASLKFVKEVTKFFDIGNGQLQTRVGVVSFAEQGDVEFKLNAHSSVAQLHTAIDKIRYTGGGSRTSLGLQTVREKMFDQAHGARSLSDGAARVVVVLTDGVWNPGYAPGTEADLLENEHVAVIAVGAGTGIRAQTKDIASQFGLYQEVVSLHNVLSLVGPVRRAACDAPVTVPCGSSGALRMNNGSKTTVRVPATGIEIVVDATLPDADDGLFELTQLQGAPVIPSRNYEVSYNNGGKTTSVLVNGPIYTVPGLVYTLTNKKQGILAATVTATCCQGSTKAANVQSDTCVVNRPGDACNDGSTTNFGTFRSCVETANRGLVQKITFDLPKTGSSTVIRIERRPVVLETATGVFVDAIGTNVLLDGDGKVSSFVVRNSHNVEIAGLRFTKFKGAGVRVENSESTHIYGGGSFDNFAAGVLIDKASSNITIGHSQHPTHIWSNAGAGIQSFGQHIRIYGVAVGINENGESAGNTLAGISSLSPGHGMTIGSPESKTIVSANKYHGIYFRSPNNKVFNTYVGIGADGATPMPNTGNGVWIDAGAHTCTIGSEDSGVAATVIAGNGKVGVYVGASDATIAGVFIGLDASGTKGVSNGGGGVIIGEIAKRCTVGSVLSHVKTVVSGNKDSTNQGPPFNGIDTAGTGTVVRGAYIGTDVTGMKAIPNGQGIRLRMTARESTIGSSDPNVKTIISGNGPTNSGHGISCWAKQTVIKGAHVGVSADGKHAIPNGLSGIQINAGCVGAEIGQAMSAPTVVGGNMHHGIDAHATARMQNVHVGVSMHNGVHVTVGNHRSGVAFFDHLNMEASSIDGNSHIAHNAHHGILVNTATSGGIGPKIGSVARGNCTVHGNGRDGVHVLGSKTRIRNCLLSSNGYAGVYVGSQARDTQIGRETVPTRITQNGEDGVVSWAEEIIIANAAITLNGGHGIWLQPHANSNVKVTDSDVGMLFIYICDTSILHEILRSNKALKI